MKGAVEFPMITMLKYVPKTTLRLVQPERRIQTMTRTNVAKAKVLLIGSGGVGTMAAYALESGGKAAVTAVLRSNYAAVQKDGFEIDSIQHGSGIKGFRPSASTASII